MKTMQKLRIAGLFLLLIAGFTAQDQVQAQPGVNISFQTFYDDLSPYGRWTNSRQYGSVWTPNVAAGFQPYSTNGYWEVTEYGNTWVSDYDWGWAPFHYGRWSFDDYLGWFWIPGYEWGPAWVNWRSGGDHYGWAPLGPGMSINVSINIPSFWWVFVPQRYISDRYWHNYCAPRSRVTHIYNQTTIINNYYTNNSRNYAYGPRRDEIERVTRRNVQVRQIDVNQRGRVITDRSGDRGYNGRTNQTYSADRSGGSYNGRSANRDYEPNARGRVYNENDNSNRGANNRGIENGRVERGGSVPERSNPAPNNTPNRRNRETYESPQSQQPSGSSERRSRGYENSRPATEPRVERSAPTYNPESSRRSERSPEYANPGGRSRGGDAPAVRQERTNSQSNGRSSQGNSGGNERSSGRSSRGPR